MNNIQTFRIMTLFSISQMPRYKLYSFHIIFSTNIFFHFYISAYSLLGSLLREKYTYICTQTGQRCHCGIPVPSDTVKCINKLNQTFHSSFFLQIFKIFSQVYSLILLPGLTALNKAPPKWQILSSWTFINLLQLYTLYSNEQAKKLQYIEDYLLSFGTYWRPD